MTRSDSIRPHKKSSWNTMPAWFLVLFRHPLAAFISIFTIPLIALALSIYTVHEQNSRTQESNDLILAAQLASRLIEEEIIRTQNIERAIISRASFVESLTNKNITALQSDLEVLLDVTPMMERVILRDKNDKILVDISPSIESTDATTNLWLHTESDQSEPVPQSGITIRGSKSGGKVIDVSMPIHYSNEIQGYLSAQYKLQDVSSLLHKIRIEPSGFLYVVDQNGYLVTHPFQLLPGQPKDVSHWPPVSVEGTAEGKLIQFTHGKDEIPWTAAVVGIESLGWRIVAQQPDAAMLQPLYNLVWSGSIIIMLIVCLISLLVIRWVRMHRSMIRLVSQQSNMLKLKGYEELYENDIGPVVNDNI